MDRSDPFSDFGLYQPSRPVRWLIDLARSTSHISGLYLVSSGARKLALALIGETPVDYDFEGLKVRFRPNGNTAEKRALLNPARFDAAELSYLKTTLPVGGVFLDIGANAGLYGLTAAKALGPGGRVLAFEPNPAVLTRLAFNVAQNPPDGTPAIAPITIVDKAVTDHNGPIRFARPSGNLGEGQVVDEGDDGEDVVTLEGRTLFDCLQDLDIQAVSGLKIDIEGHELPALSHFFGTAPESLLPGFVIIERGSPDHWAPLAALLQTKGYRQHASCHMNEIWERI